MVQVTSEPYNCEEIDEMLDKKLNISDQIDAYTKQEDDAMLLLKADKSELIDAYSKTEADAILDEKLNIIDQIDAYNKTEADALLDDKLNISDQIDAYTKGEDDALLLLKADKPSQLMHDALLLLKVDKTQLSDSYSKTEDDELLVLKLNISDQIDAYNKTEADALLDDKLNISDQIDAYTKGEDDALLLLKADKSEFVNYVDLVSILTITGQKQFGIINVSSISKQNKNDASILLAGGGDILRASETELPDMNKVMAILGAATGGGNAITDLSFDRNTLIPAKNSSFIMTNYDETITGQKTFNKTIHSVGIAVQSYDNNSVVCADGDVKAIQDINASIDFSNYYNKSQKYSQTETDQKLNLKLNISNQIDAYTKTQDDALLLLKADKTQLIDSYTKGEAYNLLNIKADSGVSCTKGEDDSLLLLKADKTQLIDVYTKGETNNLLNNKANSGASYTKGEDDALLLLKADKTQLIDAYTKGEDDALLLLKADKTQLIDSYTKGEDDALLLLKADKTQLIDSYTKGEAYNLLNIKADSGVSCTKGEDDALLLLKASQSITYAKTEIDQLLSQIEVCDVDLSGYMTLGTAYIINANKTFNNSCRFVSSIDGMATITGVSFVKSCADDTVVLLGAGSTKSLSEFASGSVDDSNYMKKTGQELQIIHGVLRRDDDELSMSEYDEDYLTRAEIYNTFVNRQDNQTMYGSKTFNANVNVTGFVKTGKDDTSVLLAGGGDALLSAFGGLELVNINYTSNAVIPTSIMSLKCYRYGSLINFYGYIYMGNGARASGASVAVCRLANAGFPKYLFYANDIVFAGSAPHVANFRFGTDGKVTITIKALSRSADAAGLSDFPELYAYIKERYLKPIGELPQPIPIGNQTLQQQVKNNDDTIYASNEEFEPPVPNAITKLDLTSYATTGVFPNGYLFKNYPQEARPKLGDQVIALVGIDASNTYTYNTFYIVDDGTCSVCVFNQYFESKGLNGGTQEVSRIPDSILPADGKKPQQSIPTDSADMNRFLMKAIYLRQAWTIEETLLVNTVVPFTNDGEHHYSIKEIKPESKIPALFDKEIIINLSDTDCDIIQIQNSFLSVVLTANIQLVYKFEKIDESYKDGLVPFVGLKSGSTLIREYIIYHRGKTIDESLQNEATTESFIYNTIKPKSEKNNRKHIDSLYENNHNFDTSACGTYISMRNIEKLIGNQTTVPDIIPIRFRGCTADMMTRLHAEPLTESGLKNLVCDIKPVTLSIKNYVITEVTANMAGYKATDACLNQVRQFYSQRPFVVPVQNSNGALTFDGLDTQNQNISVEFRGAPIYQGATDSYYNVDTSGERPPPPILCTVHDTFWLFSPAAGGSCIYDTNHSFDEAIGPLNV
ncbi:MAG: hypothetical protein EZS28_000406 [Streblomastix strix]|uniref:Uncharacterized protein n=1 Tax=Streblomastix strix TaxID=222440 RepID=A0A5J4XC04_9EUKA|nr:MAG: hypothetical protein EZS28_000406 [Streblomastix strix]